MLLESDHAGSALFEPCGGGGGGGAGGGGGHGGHGHGASSSTARGGDGAALGGGYLPSPSAPEKHLEAAGLVLLKCILDDHPIGAGLCHFVFDYLINGGEAQSLHDVDVALAALRGFDRALADSWAGLLDDPTAVDAFGFALDDFDETADPDTPVTASNLPGAILLGCRWRLLGIRHSAFSALRRGFLRCEDLQVQLAALGSSESLALLLQGKQTLSTGELLDCFQHPGSSEQAAADAGFAAAGSRVPAFLMSLLQDERVFDEKARFAMLRWCTALRTLPIGGLKEERIKLRLFGAEVDDQTLPETHTCTRELHLPNYSSVDVLRQKLLLALEHEEDGFGKE